jgi:hypothetical protein
MFRPVALPLNMTTGNLTDFRGRPENTKLSTILTTGRSRRSTQTASLADYDLQGFTKVTNARNIEKTYTYDANHKLTMSYSDTTTPGVTFTHDDFNRVDARADGSTSDLI